MISLRPAAQNDLAWIIAQERRPEFAAYIFRCSDAQHRVRMADPQRVYLIAEDAGERVGFAMLAGRDSQDGVELERMAVTAPGQGIGAVFLPALTEWIVREWSPPKIWLDVFEDNARARRASRRAGLEEIRLAKTPVRRPDGSEARLILMHYLSAENPR